MLQKPIFWISLLVIVIIGISILIFKPYSSKNLPSKLSEKPKPEAAAIVNGEKIRIEDFEKLQKANRAFLTEVYPKMGGATISEKSLGERSGLILESLVQEVLLAQYLKKKGVVITDEEALAYLKKTAVDPLYNGDWGAYKKHLEEFRTSLENVLHKARKELAAEKIAELEKIDPGQFENWYFELKKRSVIKIFIET